MKALILPQRMIRTLLIDDQPACLDDLEYLIRKEALPLDVVAKANSAPEGLAAILKHKPELVFLDIVMPGMTGFEMLELLPQIDFQLIITTTEDKFAIHAIRASALDFLLKPLQVDELKDAVQRLLERRDIPEKSQIDLLGEMMQEKNRMAKRMAVSSELHKGSVFSFQLSYPVSSDLPESGLQSSQTEWSSQLKGMHVLLADDNEYNRLVARETLQSAIPDIRISEAADGTEVLDILENEVPDVILMDVVMPEMDGLETTRYIRTKLRPPVSSVRILALTANVLKSEWKRCQDAGMDGFIPKPFRPNELMNEMTRVLKQAQPSGASSVQQESFMPLVQIMTLKRYSGGDAIREQLFRDQFIQTMPDLCEQLTTGIQQQLAGQIRVAAHTMKTPFRTMGIQEGVDACQHIEERCMQEEDMQIFQKEAQQIESLIRRALNELRA